MEGLALKKRLMGTIPEVRALEAEPDIGLLLPCNVVLRQEGEEVEVLIQDPQGCSPSFPRGLGKGWEACPRRREPGWKEPWPSFRVLRNL
jgi:hypothetical protein